MALRGRDEYHDECMQELERSREQEMMDPQAAATAAMRAQALATLWVGRVQISRG